MLPNKKTKLNLAILLMAAALSMAAVGYAAPMGTAFTYQGQLANANSPAEGLYDFEFAVFDALDGGSQQGSTLSQDDKDVIDGYFTVTLDFGAGVFTADARWLQIAVRGAGTENFTTLTPRRELTPTPYALYALSGTQGPKGDKGDTGDTGPQGPMGPEGPAGDAVFSIEDFVAGERIGYITIDQTDIRRETVFGIRFGISALPPPGAHGPPEAVDEVELILDGGTPGLLSLIENIGTPNTYPDVSVTLGEGPSGGGSLIMLDMREVTVNSVDFFGQVSGSAYRSLAYVSFSIQGYFELDIADEAQIRYDVHQGLTYGPTCSTALFNVHPPYVSGVSLPYIPLTDFDIQISPSDETVGDPFPCISTITTKTESYQGTACIWTNCLSLSSIDMVRVRLYSRDDYLDPFYLDTSFEISQAYPQTVKIYSTNESTYHNNPVQMEMTYSMNQVVISDDDQGGDPVTVVSCQQPR